MLVVQVGQVVAGQAAVERRENRLDALSFVLGNLCRAAIHRTDAIGTSGGGLQGGCVHGTAVQRRAVEQNGAQIQHVIAGLAVGAAALPAGIGADHAADGGAVGSRQFRGEKQPVGFERGVELVLDHPALHPYPALLDIDLKDVVQVP